MPACENATLRFLPMVGMTYFPLKSGEPLFIALGIFANLAFEEIGLDLYVVALLALIAVGLFLTRRRQPILLYYSAAYVLGLIATFAYKGFSFV